MSEQIFNQKERTILQLLHKSRSGLTLYEISRETGVAWVTVRKYMGKFVKKGLVITVK